MNSKPCGLWSKFNGSEEGGRNQASHVSHVTWTRVLWKRTRIPRNRPFQAVPRPKVSLWWSSNWHTSPRLKRRRKKKPVYLSICVSVYSARRDSLPILTVASYFPASNKKIYIYIYIFDCAISSNNEIDDTVKNSLSSGHDLHVKFQEFYRCCERIEFFGTARLRRIRLSPIRDINIPNLRYSRLTNPLGINRGGKKSKSYLIWTYFWRISREKWANLDNLGQWSFPGWNFCEPTFDRGPWKQRPK